MLFAKDISRRANQIDFHDDDTIDELKYRIHL